MATDGTVSDGPYPETKEVLGGFAVVDGLRGDRVDPGGGGVAPGGATPVLGTDAPRRRRERAFLAAWTTSLRIRHSANARAADVAVWHQP